MTGLAVLTFLAHGETTLSKDFGKTVQTGIEWLCKQVNSNGGKILGKVITAAVQDACILMVSLLMLSEATAMIGASQIEEAMNAAIEVIVEGQRKWWFLMVIRPQAPVTFQMHPTITRL